MSMTLHFIQLPLRAADADRLLKFGFVVIIYGQLCVTAYRRIFDPATGWVDMSTNLLCTFVAHSLFFCRDWLALPLDSSCGPGFVRQIWHYSTLPRTRMYFGICARTQILTMGLRHLLPPLLLLPLGKGSLFRLLREIVPSRWGGGGGIRSALERMAITRRWLPRLALTIVRTAAGCWLVSSLGAFLDNHELRLIQDPEEDERWNQWVVSELGQRWSTLDLVGKSVATILLGIGYSIRLWVTQS
ncbi:hypothetical protein PGQ11_009858 [Apiospora arundinis]|uniref:Uncharacterized protein n=1 Tax=Apiospora arundinis TaxID=335852 RepID=A0ABR2I7T6_9PEZI